jgi:hypothetical protein
VVSCQDLQECNQRHGISEKNVHSQYIKGIAEARPTLQGGHHFIGKSGAQAGVVSENGK